MDKEVIKALIAYEQAKAKALRQYVLNRDFNLKADVCDFTVKELKKHLRNGK